MINEGTKVIISDNYPHKEKRGLSGIVRSIRPTSVLIEISFPNNLGNLCVIGKNYIEKYVEAIDINGVIKLRITSKLFLVNNKLDGKDYYCKTKRKRVSGVGKKFIGRGLNYDNIVKIK